MYEGGLRQAAFAWWPGTVPAGRVSHDPWAFWDYLPTAAELTGARLPTDLKHDGRSLVSFLKGGPAPKREYFYWELHEQGSGSIQAVRWGDWKAVKNGRRNRSSCMTSGGMRAKTKNLAAEKPDLAATAAALMKSARADDPTGL